ncbi:MAG: DUF3192 domain-containing protein [Planctomycetes bacterium]|nr:DUF3192 domain-containing protein [Planctomycetota bacterium]
MSRFAVILFVSGLAGCNYSFPTMEEVRSINRQRLLKLTVGMSKTDVLKTMGTKIALTYEGERVTNPYKNETMKGADGQTYEVIYYYTDIDSRDLMVTQEELTPIVLKDEKVVGWGHAFLKQQLSSSKKTGNSSQDIGNKK